MHSGLAPVFCFFFVFFFFFLSSSAASGRDLIFGCDASVAGGVRAFDGSLAGSAGGFGERGMGGQRPGGVQSFRRIFSGGLQLRALGDPGECVTFDPPKNDIG